MHSEKEVIEIKLNKRLLLTTAAGVAIILSAVLVVSMNGNDKPIVTTNPPSNEQQPPASDTDTPTANIIVTPTGPGTNDEDNEQGPGDHSGPGDNGNGTGPSDAPKKHGLERAIEVHERNIAKKVEKGNVNALKNLDAPKGLTHSLENLQLNLQKHLDNHVLEESGNNGHGQAKGHINT